MSYKSCFPRRSSIDAWFSNCKCIRMMSYWYFQVCKLPLTKTGCQEQSSEPKYTPKPSSSSGGWSQWLDWSLTQVWYAWDGKCWGRHGPFFPEPTHTAAFVFTVPIISYALGNSGCKRVLSGYHVNMPTALKKKEKESSSWNYWKLAPFGLVIPCMEYHPTVRSWAHPQCTPSGKCESWQPDRPVHRASSLYNHPAQLQPLKDKTNYINNLAELQSSGELKHA